MINYSNHYFRTEDENVWRRKLFTSVASYLSIHTWWCVAHHQLLPVAFCSLTNSELIRVFSSQCCLINLHPQCRSFGHSFIGTISNFSFLWIIFNCIASSIPSVNHFRTELFSSVEFLGILRFFCEPVNRHLGGWCGSKTWSENYGIYRRSTKN